MFPLLIIVLVNKFNFFSRIGSIVLVYIVGVILGNLKVLPADIYSTQDLLTTISIPLAIPLLIFNFNIKKWLKLAKPTLISLLVTILSVLIIVIVSSFIFDDGSNEYWKIPGMLVGVYTGGTPNLAAIKVALDVKPDTYILVHTFDMVFSSIYLLFLMLFGKKLFALFLPKYKGFETEEDQVGQDKMFINFFQKDSYKEYPKAIGLSVLIFAVAGLLSLLVSADFQMLVVILAITSLGIAFSFIPSVSKLKSAFDLGMYFILVFSFVVASMADFSNLSIDSLYLFLNVGFVIFGSIILQLIFSRIFKIDTDTTLISSTALICSPPFVPVIAGAIKNKEIIFSGLTIGIIGYAVGTYLGVFIAFFFK